MLKKINFLHSNKHSDDKFFISPDDERSIAVFVDERNRVFEAYITEKFKLSPRGLMRFYTALKQVRYGWLRELTESLLRLDYGVFCAYDFCTGNSILVDGNFNINRYSDNILKARYIGNKDRSKSASLYGIIGGNFEDFKKQYMDNKDFMELVSDFENCIIIEYSPIQREMVMTFLSNILSTYRLF